MTEPRLTEEELAELRAHNDARMAEIEVANEAARKRHAEQLREEAEWESEEVEEQ